MSQKEYSLAVSQLRPGASFNPACFEFEEQEARSRKLWRDTRSMPTLAEVDAVLNEYHKQCEKINYKKLRQAEYPAVGDQLDAIWKQLKLMQNNDEVMNGECADYLKLIDDIKAKYPKA